MRNCEVYVNNIKAGILTEEDNGDYVFQYSADYLKNADAKIVSLTLPLQSEPYRSRHLFPSFANMLSEGENRVIQSRFHHLDPEDDFGIMLETCQSDTIGAVTIKPLNK